MNYQITLAIAIFLVALNVFLSSCGQHKINRLFVKATELYAEALLNHKQKILELENQIAQLENRLGRLEGAKVQ